MTETLVRQETSLLSPEAEQTAFDKRFEDITGQLDVLDQKAPEVLQELNGRGQGKPNGTADNMHRSSWVI